MACTRAPAGALPPSGGAVDREPPRRPRGSPQAFRGRSAGTTHDDVDPFIGQGGEDADDEGTDSEKLDGLNVSDHSGDSGDSAAASDESHTPPEVVEEPKVDE